MNVKSDYQVEVPLLDYSKLGWHKKHIVEEAYNNDGKYGYLFADNKHLRRLIEWGWLIQISEWGKYQLTPEGMAAYERQRSS